MKWKLLRGVMYKLDLRKKQWTSKSGKIRGPSPRAFHSCSTVGKDLFIYGGVDRHHVFSDILIFHTTSYTWDIFEIQNTSIEPPALFFHTSTYFDNRLVIWGGTGPHSYSDRLYICDLTKGEWSEVRKGGENQVWPTPRANHTATLVPGTNDLYIIGGFSMDLEQNKTYYDDLYILNLVELSWKKVNAKLPVDAKDGLWSGRSGHTATFFPFAFGQTNVITIFGGRTMSSDLCFALNEVWTLSTRNHQLTFHQVCQDEETLLMPKSELHSHEALESLPYGAVLAVPLPRRNHTATKWGTKLLVIGGWSGKEKYGSDLKDVRELEANFIPAQRSTYRQDMRQGMESLLDNKDFSDLTLQAEGGEKLYVNKAIVGCRCPKLACCIKSGMRESKGEIRVSYRYPVLRALIEYCYLDRVEISPDISVELLQAADEFMLDRLKQLCEDVIIPAIDSANVVHVLLNADCYRATRLRSAAVNFVLSNWEELEVTGKLADLSQPIRGELEIMRQED